MGKFESVKREQLQKEAKEQLNKMVEEIIPLLKEKQLYSLPEVFEIARYFYNGGVLSNQFQREAEILKAEETQKLAEAFSLVYSDAFEILDKRCEEFDEKE